jgi:hypothetical protein
MCVASLNIQVFLLYYSKEILYLKETNDSFHRLTLANSLRQTQVKKLKMKISYKKRNMNFNLIFGLMWLVWFYRNSNNR